MSELKFNVAQLLREPIGGRRNHTFELDVLPLDEALRLREITGEVRFTRSGSGVVADVKAHGTVRLTCVRSLEEFDEPVDVSFSDEYHSIVDILTGSKLPTPREEDPYFLSDTHMADIGAALREYALLELPMYPVCPEYRDTPISYSTDAPLADEQEAAVEPVDARLAALKDWKQNG
jgi:uncharacterized protein